MQDGRKLPDAKLDEQWLVQSQMLAIALCKVGGNCPEQSRWQLPAAKTDGNRLPPRLMAISGFKGSCLVQNWWQLPAAKTYGDCLLERQMAIACRKGICLVESQMELPAAKAVA